MNRYLCKCGRAVNKSTNADNTGNRETEGCEGCPYLMPWGEQKYNHDTKHFYLDIKGYECRMSQTLEYETRFGGSVTDRCTCYIASLDFDFLERVSAWIKEHYPDGQISGTFSRETIRAVEYVSNGRYRLSISCAQNKAGIAAKAALFNAFFDESGRRFDMDADAEKAKILRDIERGKAAAHSVAAAPDKETKTMLIYRDPATGWLYRVSPQPENGIYAMQYRDPANSVVWKPDITWNTNAVYRDREHLQEGLEARAKRDGWELVSGPASSEPPEVVDEGEEYSPCDTCRCPDCIDSSCPQAGCDKTDGGFGCFAPYEECPAPAEKTWPDEHLVKDKISDCCYFSGVTSHLIGSKLIENVNCACEDHPLSMADGVAIAHDALCGGCDNLSQAHNNQYSKDTFGAWCGSIGMLYCDYDTYAAMGGAMSAEQYGVWGPRASRKIDELTLGRAEGHAADLKTELEDACSQMADAMLQQSNARSRSAGGLLTAASNDGYSESYAAVGAAGRAAAGALYDILSDSLGTDPYGLLYRGCC